MQGEPKLRLLSSKVVFRNDTHVNHINPFAIYPHAPALTALLNEVAIINGLDLQLMYI